MTPDAETVNNATNQTCAPPADTTTPVGPDTSGDIVEQVHGVLTEAAHHDPIAAWLVPDPMARYGIVARCHAFTVRYLIHYGDLRAVVDPDGVVVGVLAGAHPTTCDKDLAATEYTPGLLTAAVPYHHRYATLRRATSAALPRRAHYHLWYIAAHPDRRGDGIGGDMLTELHRRLDALGQPAYIEVATTALRTTLTKRGYQHETTIHLPDSGPTLYGMWRDPLPFETAIDRGDPLRY
ncbi:hypothetical protein V6U90_25530 [Micromonospora sp. CPCC 206060]|uniref:hypothetical protein n=1 Tax=Micromonospora sp. CPCC 206060 TaxID=3122406 RepID=UPI002FF23796